MSKKKVSKKKTNKEGLFIVFKGEVTIEEMNKKGKLVSSAVIPGEIVLALLEDSIVQRLEENLDGRTEEADANCKCSGSCTSKAGNARVKGKKPSKGPVNNDYLVSRKT